MRLIAAAVVVAGALIAAGIALANRFSIAGTGNLVSVFRLNNWTGEILLCKVEITQQGLGRLTSCRKELTDAEVGRRDDWIPVPKAQQTDQFGGVRVPEPKTK